MREIMITRRKSGDRIVVDVDDEDYEELIKYTWHVAYRYTAIGIAYAYRRTSKEEQAIGYKKAIAMHRQILGVVLKPDIEIDHKNGDTLDNRKENLRIVTRSQNSMNRTKQDNTVSVYKGVSLDARRGKWKAKLNKDGREYWLGYFATQEDAARAYNNKAMELFGDFARLNVVL